MKKTEWLNRNFVFLLLGQISSLIGNGTLKFALAMYVLERTGSAAVFAGMLSAAMLPTIVLSPFGGVLADRMNRRALMIALDALSGLAALLAGAALPLGHDLPLIAAGGIATGAGMLAAFALGAEGCQLGTRFALSRESSACEAFKRRCVEVQEGGTILTLKKVIPTRLVRNGFCRTVEEAESRGADAEELSALIGRGRPKRGIFEGDLDEGELEIGQIAALIEDLPPAGEILRRLVAEYEAARGSLGPL